MSGHSKWSKVKHQKAVTDAVKGQAFTRASRGITIAVKEGGGIANPDMNFKLRLAIEKARMVNMPKENIERAIEKGKNAGGDGFEQILYEGYGPSGVAILVEAATDNRQRTVSVIKNILERHGGTLASPGAVSYLFDAMGLIVVEQKNRNADMLMEVALNYGAEDVEMGQEVGVFFTKPAALMAVKMQAEQARETIVTAELTMRPKVYADVAPAVEAIVQTCIEQIEAYDDVQKVFTNMA